MRSSHAKEPSDNPKTNGNGLLPDRPNLTKKQIEFLHVYTASPFLPLKEICRQAGVTPSQVASWKKNSTKFLAALETEHRRSRQAVNMSRKSVMRGILEAIDMAKDMRQPSSMITGWKEIGRMCGFYEPERREIKLSVDGQQLIEQMRTIPKERLLELAAQQDAVDAEFEVISSEGDS
jgi:hypothetical protein